VGPIVVKSILMRLRVTVLLGLVAAAVDVCGSSLLVLSKHDHTLAVVDPQTLKVLGKAPIGPDPHEVIASADGGTAYVSNYGFGAYHTIAVVDLKNITTQTPIDLGALAGPHGLTFVGGKLWFTAEGAKVIGRYDPASGKIEWVLGTGQDRTHMIYVTADEKRIYTTNVSSGTVSIIDKMDRPPIAGPPPGAGGPNGGAAPAPPSARRGPTGPPGGFWDQRLVEVGVSSEGFDITPDGRQLWAADAQTGDVSVVDLEKARLVETLPVGAKGANRLKFTPDGKLVFISSLSNTGLIILDAASHKEVKRIATPRGAAGIQMDPDGSRAFVSCTGEGMVDVVDLKTLTVTGKIDAGPEPDGLAWVAGGR
jgi:DNA-binding beta-propeller fold protein YncE